MDKCTQKGINARKRTHKCIWGVVYIYDSIHKCIFNAHTNMLQSIYNLKKSAYKNKICKHICDVHKNISCFKYDFWDSSSTTLIHKCVFFLQGGRLQPIRCLYSQSHECLPTRFFLTNVITARNGSRLIWRVQPMGAAMTDGSFLFTVALQLHDWLLPLS